MTIIEPHRNKKYLAEMIYLSFLVCAGAISCIYFYNLNVELKHQLAINERSVKELEAVNADLRDKIYKAVDPKNLSKLIAAQNLVADKNPEYLENKPLARY